VAGSLTYYLVCDQTAPLFSSYCFALLFAKCPCGLLFASRTAASSPLVLQLALPLALPLALDEGLFWGFGVFCVGFTAVLVAADTAQTHVCTFLS